MADRDAAWLRGFCGCAPPVRPVKTVEVEFAPLYPAQAAAIDDPARISCIEASTKAGKTSGCLLWLLRQAMENGAPGRTFRWVAPVSGQSAIAYRRGRQLLPAGVYEPNETSSTLTLANGSRIEFRSGERPDSLYGEDVYAAVLDECSRMRQEAWHAVRSTLTATSGPARLIGNVKGRRNWFWQLCRRAEAGAEGLAYHRLTWREAVAAGVIDAAEIDQARADLPEAVFRELYEAEASDDQSNPFGTDAIRACITPLAEGPALRCGVDLARAVDYSVVIGLNADARVCVFDRWHQLPWAETLERIDRNVDGVHALVDATGIGDPLLEALQRPIATNDHMASQSGLALRTARANYEGFHFSQPAKQMLMERLAVAIHRQEIGFPDGPIVAELETFEYEYGRTGVRYSAPPGMHDDCVVALALALWSMPARVSTRQVPSGPPPPGGVSRWRDPAMGGGGRSSSKWGRYN